VIPKGSPVALINSPRAGLHNVIVVEGTTGGDLQKGPGHLPNTPLPGQAGESVVMGKGITAGAPFGGITRLRQGDVITVRTGQGYFHFVVEGRLVPGGKRPVVPGNVSLLTLVTSTGSGLMGRLTPRHVIYVEAKLHGKAVTAPRGRPKSVLPAEVQGHNDPGAWLYVGLWSLALVAGTVAFWRLWSRWGLLRTWLVGAPVLFGILWGLSDEAMRLLPNIY
jgi:sortase A